jgi:hypothetical protein
LQETSPETPDNDCNSPPTGPGPAGTCPAGTLRVCIDQCMPVVGLRGACTNDLCSGQGNVCDVNLTCQPGSAGSSSGTCVAAAPIDENCSLSLSAEANLCPAGTYCRDLKTCASQGGLNLPEAQPQCSHFVVEGSTCDGDFVDATNANAGTICDACEPGTTCAPLIGTQLKTCQRTCEPSDPDDPLSAPSCPCSGALCLIPNPPTYPYAAHCIACFPDNNTQCGGDTPCCDGLRRRRGQRLRDRHI